MLSKYYNIIRARAVGISSGLSMDNSFAFRAFSLSNAFNFEINKYWNKNSWRFFSSELCIQYFCQKLKKGF